MLNRRRTGESSESRCSMLKANGYGKQSNVVFTNELARRYKSPGIISTSLHPEQSPFAHSAWYSRQYPRASSSPENISSPGQGSTKHV
ncbi:hypothetical protein FRC12_012363 [Ceratobasidium sp. 428]|nr:hypothetical protein FRC12_012363 [Ceratobasidium sp. 428]